MRPYKVSIATACYNSEQFIERTYQSIVNQRYEPLEWNVVVDGLTDTTLSILESIQQAAPFRVNIIVFEVNRGSTAAVTAAVQACTGQFTMILDHDDELMPDALHGLLRAWDAVSKTHDSSTLSGIFGRCVNERNEFLGRPTPPLIVGKLGHFLYQRRCRAECAVLHRTDLVQKYYRFKPHELGSTNGLVWNRIDREYDSIFTDLVVRRYYTDVAGSQSNSRKIKAPSALANQELELLNDNVQYLLYDPIVLLKKIAMYHRYALHADRGLVSPMLALAHRELRVASVCVWPIAWWLALKDQRADRVED